MTQLRILISGAGIAGNALAFWLTKLGHTVTVVERSPALRMNGLQIDLRGAGITVLKRMGLDEAFRAHRAPELGIQLVDTNGRRWAFFGANTSGKGPQGFTSEYEIMRGDLCKIMHDITKDKARYIFGTYIESYHHGKDCIRVRLANDSVEEYDLIVGADGLHSRTRNMMFGPDGEGFKALDENIAYFRIQKEIQQGEEYVATAYIAPTGQFVLTRRNNEHELQVYFMGKKIRQRLEGVDRGDVDSEKRVFAQEFRGAGWVTDELVSEMMESNDFYCERQGIVKLDGWSSGQVTLLGDAGYGSGASGLGTSAALVGAYVLAGEIGRFVGRGKDGGGGKQSDKSEGLKMALEAYEKTLRGHVDWVHKGIGEEGWLDSIEVKAWHVGILYWVMWLAAQLRLDKVAGLMMGDGGKWVLPDYEELNADVDGNAATV